MSKFNMDEVHRVADCLVRLNPGRGGAQYIMDTAVRQFPFPETGYYETMGFCVTAYVTSEGNHQYKVTLSSYGVMEYIKEKETCDAH
jgi:hypothetical protein